MNKRTAGIIATISAIILIIFVITVRKSSAPGQNPDNKSNSGHNAQKTFTKAEVVQHNTMTDCWTIVEREVYDITKYVPRHPGGDEILSACGNDATTLFTSRQTSDGQKVGSGTPHSQNAENILQSFHLGALKD